MRILKQKIVAKTTMNSIIQTNPHDKLFALNSDSTAESILPVKIASLKSFDKLHTFKSYFNFLQKVHSGL